MLRRIALCMALALPASAVAQTLPSFDELNPQTLLADRSSLPEVSPIEESRDALLPASGRFSVEPDWSLTPGVLCDENDEDFTEYRYPEQIPYCRRNTSQEDKREVSRWYGVPWEEHSKYQYDHLLSLCLGGSNDLRNLWPMLYAEARKKAGMEFQLCERLRKGEITQNQAVATELGWFSENAPHLLERVQGLRKLLNKQAKSDESPKLEKT